jgi:hypothetical protein
MNTKQFIEKHSNRIKNGGKFITRDGYNRCASVRCSIDTIYSYGYHYPLLWKVVNPQGIELMVCNDSGYSNTTSKHIGKAAMYADLCVHLTGDKSYSNVLDCINRRIDALYREMITKKRKDTHVYRSLRNEYYSNLKALTTLYGND